jgi:hypothetical protein
MSLMRYELGFISDMKAFFIVTVVKLLLRVNLDLRSK